MALMRIMINLLLHRPTHSQQKPLICITGPGPRLAFVNPGWEMQISPSPQTPQQYGLWGVWQEGGCGWPLMWGAG